jgi:hypothetical protein
MTCAVVWSLRPTTPEGNAMSYAAYHASERSLDLTLDEGGDLRDINGHEVEQSHVVSLLQRTHGDTSPKIVITVGPGYREDVIRSLLAAIRREVSEAAAARVTVRHGS